MDPFKMVVWIVAIVAIASVLRAKYGIRHESKGRRGLADETRLADPDADRMREELRALRERVAVLERILTDSDRSAMLDREIEALRARD